jgi:hypothetical protein
MSGEESDDLLSADEAKAQLRDMIEQFFFRKLVLKEGSPPVRQLLVKSPPGLGKTKEAMRWAIRYQPKQGKKTKNFASILDMAFEDFGPADVVAQCAIFVPRHQLAKQIKRTIKGEARKIGRAVAVPILRGRDNEAESGRAPC